MKKSQVVRLISVLVFCSMAAGQVSYAQDGAQAAAVKVAASDSKGDAPPSYFLVLAGVGAMLFINSRRRR